MNRAAVIRRGLAVVIALAALATPLMAQRPEHEEYTNLKVLPKDIAPQELRALMNSFTRALGVRCIHCHVGEEGKPFKTEDFPKDDKPTKLKAREMIRMTQDLNDKYLANLANRSDPPIRIKCMTCHHGLTQPRLLEDVLKTAYDTGGMDSTLARYRALRERYYGRFAYDFGEVPLIDLAGKVRTAGNREDVLQLLTFNVEMNPNSAYAKRQQAASSLALAFVSGADSGAAAYGRLQQRYGAALVNEGLVNGIGYDLIGVGKLDAAIAAFAFNVAQNPNSADAYDSMGEGYYQKGDRKQAVAAYQKSLELDPSNQNAIDKLKELKAKPKPAKKS